MTPTPALIPTKGSLPSGYAEVLYWRISDQRGRGFVLQLLAIPLFILFGVMFFGVAIGLGMMPSRLTFGLSEINVAFVAVVLTLVLHELVHGLVMKWFGASPHFGILWKKALLYTTSPGFAYRRNVYMNVLLAPLLVLSILALVGMWLFQGTAWVAILGLCATFNASGAIGDIWMTRILRRYPPAAYVMDERDGMRVLLPRPADTPSHSPRSTGRMFQDRVAGLSG